jgi:hypothetical protein
MKVKEALLHIEDVLEKSYRDEKVKHSFFTLNFHEGCLLLNLLKDMLKKPSKTNLLRTIAFPFVKAIPTLRMIIVAVAEKLSIQSPYQ